MKLEYTTGCICDSMTINGKETIDMRIDDVKDAIQEMIYNETDLATLQNVFETLIASQGTYECSDKPCGCCDEFIITYKLEL